MFILFIYLFFTWTTKNVYEKIGMRIYNWIYFFIGIPKKLIVLMFIVIFFYLDYQKCLRSQNYEQKKKKKIQTQM